EALEKSVASKAAEVYKSTQTPLEQFQTKVEELSKLLDAGAISWETYERAVNGAAGAILNLNKSQEKLAGAAEFGSQEAFATIAKASSPGPTSGLERLQDAIKQEIEVLRQQKNDIGDIARAARGGFLTPAKI